MHVRAELLASEEDKLPVWLGLAYDWIVAETKAITGLNLDQIEYMLVAFSPTEASEPPQASVVVSLCKTCRPKRCLSSGKTRRPVAKARSNFIRPVPGHITFRQRARAAPLW